MARTVIVLGPGFKTCSTPHAPEMWPWSARKPMDTPSANASYRRFGWGVTLSVDRFEPMMTIRHWKPWAYPMSGVVGGVVSAAAEAVPAARGSDSSKGGGPGGGRGGEEWGI